MDIGAAPETEAGKKKHLEGADLRSPMPPTFLSPIKPDRVDPKGGSDTIGAVSADVLEWDRNIPHSHLTQELASDLTSILSPSVSPITDQVLGRKAFETMHLNNMSSIFEFFYLSHLSSSAAVASRIGFRLKTRKGWNQRCRVPAKTLQ